MNPNDPSRDPSRVREEKAGLYQSAVEAWEKGEVTSALGKLEELAAMDRDFPDPETGTSSTYRNFYNQVRILRRVEEEPDLDRRIGILEEALTQFPGDARYERALDLVREKRNLVTSIVAQARFFEERGQFNDALDQWQLLKAIHDKQPGLQAEIQRLVELRDKQAPKPEPKQGKSLWAEQAAKYLESGDYQRASQSVAIGLIESPTDPELLALEEQVRKSQEGGTRALELLAKARESSDGGYYDDALAALREAYSLDSRNAVIRTVLVNSLLEHARRVVDSDWESAEAMVREVLRLEPNHPQAPTLVSQIRERMLAQPSAPGAPPPFPPTPPPPAPFPPTPVLPSEPPPVSLRQDPTLAVPTSVTQALLALSVPKEPGPPPPPLPPLPAFVPPPPAATAPPAVPTPRKPVPPTAGHTKKLLLGTALAAGLLVVIALIVTFSRHRKPAPPPPASTKYAIVLHSTPEGAEIKINGNSCGVTTCSLELPAGNYQAEAQLTGYQGSTQPFTVGPGTAREFNLTLAPQGPHVTIFTDLADGTVTLDDAPAVQIQGGGAEIANLVPGKHVLVAKGGESSASIPIEIAAGVAPKLSGNIEAKNLRSFVVAGFGGEARVYGNGTGYRATLDGKILGNITADGLPLTGLSPGTHELAIDSDAGHDRIAFESQPSATLYVSLNASQDLGILTVETNEDQVHLLVDGKRFKRDTVRGRLVANILPRKYTLSVQKDGFAPTAEQTVEIKRGLETKVTFTLVPAKAILAVHHAPPGTDVLVDNISRGATHPDGEFQVGGIDPGRHAVTLRHDGFKPLQTEQTFEGGKTVDLQGTLEAAPTTGTLRFEINPPGVDARIRIRRDGDAQEREVSGPSVTVPEGHYVVFVSAPQYTPTSTTVQVTAGGTATASVTLRRAEPPKPIKTTPTVTFGLEDWLKVPGWVSKDGMVAHKGGDWAMAPPDITQGTIRFTVVSIKGKHVEFMLERDEKNYVHYELDEKSLVRYEFKNGSKVQGPKLAHGLDKKKPMGIGLHVTPQSIVLMVFRGGWLDLDTWNAEGPPVHGRFGFRTPGSDEIGLQDFTITPN
jgi:tetratricopeptide (TPR) repeat protein